MFSLLKQILTEGGKATEKLGTVRADQAAMKAAIEFVSKTTGMKASVLADRLLGSARLTYNGKQKDSGDVDIAVNETEVDKDSIVQKMTDACGNPPHVTGGSTYSFAVPAGEIKVQVDLMFVPDVDWAKFSHFAAENSKHKSGVRNELIHSALKYSMKAGQDVRVKDKEGNDIVRASRAYKLDVGVERLFKVAPIRKDGKGRVKGVKPANPDEVEQTLKDLGLKRNFSKEPDIIRDPTTFANMLFGPDVSPDDMASTEQMIALIAKYKKKYAAEIFRDAVKGIKRLKFPVPDELKQYE